MSTDLHAMTHAQAEALLGTRASRKLCNNTYLERTGLDSTPLALRLHMTRVVQWHLDGTISLHTGGWETVTTCDRMNRVLPSSYGRVYSQQGTWYLASSQGTIVFFTGMRLDARGHVVNLEREAYAYTAALAAAHAREQTRRERSRERQRTAARQRRQRQQEAAELAALSRALCAEESSYLLAISTTQPTE